MDPLEREGFGRSTRGIAGEFPDHRPGVPATLTARPNAGKLTRLGVG